MELIFFRTSQVYVDTVGPPETYQAKLERIFPSITKIVVAKKADSKYPIVSAASICAKVTRDDVLRHWVFAESGIEENVSREFGSGYPSGKLMAMRLVSMVSLKNKC